MPDHAVGPVEEGDRGALGKLMAQALHFPADAAETYTSRVGVSNLRVVRTDGEMVGGLALIPMGQWWGGRRVAMTGIAAVGVAPEQRGRGAAHALMTGVLRELQERGVPLSTLFASNLPLYRKSGYERAGTGYIYRVEGSRVGVSAREPEMERLDGDERDVLEPIYTEWARRTNGNVDRTPFMWNRLIEGKESRSTVYTVGREGYVAYSQGLQHEPVRVWDYAALTSAAARRILAFFTDHRIMASEIRWVGGPADPLIAALPDVRHDRVFKVHEWMMRVVDIESAFGDRGYAEAASGELQMEVADDILPENGGRWRLRVEGGRGELTRGGEGRMKLDARGLAMLYGGLLRPRELRDQGMLESPDADLATAELVFAGPSPWMTDSF